MTGNKEQYTVNRDDVPDPTRRNVHDKYDRAAGGEGPFPIPAVAAGPPSPLDRRSRRRSSLWKWMCPRATGTEGAIWPSCAPGGRGRRRNCWYFEQSDHRPRFDRYLPSLSYRRGNGGVCGLPQGPSAGPIARISPVTVTHAGSRQTQQPRRQRSRRAESAAAGCPRAAPATQPIEPDAASRGNCDLFRFTDAQLRGGTYDRHPIPPQERSSGRGLLRSCWPGSREAGSFASTICKRFPADRQVAVCRSGSPGVIRVVRWGCGGVGVVGGVREAMICGSP